MQRRGVSTIACSSTRPRGGFGERCTRWRVRGAAMSSWLGRPTARLISAVLCDRPFSSMCRAGGAPVVDEIARVGTRAPMLRTARYIGPACTLSLGSRPRRLVPRDDISRVVWSNSNLAARGVGRGPRPCVRSSTHHHGRPQGGAGRRVDAAGGWPWSLEGWHRAGRGRNGSREGRVPCGLSRWELGRTNEALAGIERPR